VDDPQRKPGSSDRDPLVARIRRAADQGRISDADRDIRIGNVGSAQSMAELDLMSRDLDQLEATLPSGSSAAPAWSGPTPEPVADLIAEKAVDAAKATARSIGVVTAVILAIALVGAGATALLAFRGGSGTDTSDNLHDPLPSVTQVPSAEPSVDDPATPAPTGAAYSLTGPGVRAFLALYRERFGTSQVIDLTMYGDYVIVDVPVPGKARHEGWLYREGGFTSFGGIMANFPGSQPVDVDHLAVPELMRNVALARTTLNVESPDTTYVIVRHIASADEVPSVDIHVSNEFHESGYLATRLDGTVERAYPYAS
jgi:hypothetical protein